MSSAENLILRHVQKEQYAKELSSIRRNESVSKSSPIAKLCPVIRDGLIVVGGRLKHAAVSQGVRTPIILPRDHQVSDMIIREYHNDAHLGTEWVLSRIRSRFWIINARNQIKRVKRTCVTCKRLFAAAMTQKMADLPPERWPTLWGLMLSWSGAWPNLIVQKSFKPRDVAKSRGNSILHSPPTMEAFGSEW